MGEGSQDLGCEDGQGLPGRQLQGQMSFLAPSIRPSTPRPWEAVKVLVPIYICGGRKGCSHYVSALDPEESLEVALPWWELAALAATCVLMPGQKCPNPMALR